MSTSARHTALEESSSPQYYTVRHANPTDFLSAFTMFVRSIVPGIVVVLFYQCMRALLSPTNYKHKAGGIRWRLVALTTAMFLFSTAALTLNLDALSSLYIDNRVRPSLHLPGSLGYLNTQETLSTVLTSLISLNQWLADGLLVSSVSMSVVQVFYLIHSSRSFTVAMFFIQ